VARDARNVVNKEEWEVLEKLAERKSFEDRVPDKTKGSWWSIFTCFFA